MRRDNAKIVLTNYNKRLIETDRFRNDLISDLGDSLFRFESMNQIVYHSLKSIYPINRYLKNHKTSIDKKCGEVLDYFGIKKVLETSIENLSTNKITNNDDELVKSYTQRYLEIILRLSQPPKFEYESLLIQSEKHLKTIIENIDNYSREKVVVNFRAKFLKPSSHEERTILDFYLRCINEQKEILDFIYNDGLKERAILKSTHFFIKDIPLSFIYGFSDFPYYSSEHYNSGYFNHKLINKSAHRVGDFPIKESYYLENLYDSNKEKFYRRYFKRNSLNQIIKEIESNLDHLPLNPDRIEFFKELIYLFRKKRWVSFCKLTLKPNCLKVEKLS